MTRTDSISARLSRDLVGQPAFCGPTIINEKEMAPCKFIANL